MKVVMLPAARREMLLAARWYDRQSPGLGDRLLDELRTAILDVKELPCSPAALDDTYRRKLVDGFPFGLIYRIDDQTITIVAVMHLKRRPGYWRRRIPR